jgi:DNA helicase HerA-like ATPase
VTLTGIAAEVRVGTNPLTQLFAGARRLGGIYHLDYERAIVITDDLAKRECGGVPRHGFLLAAATVPDQESQQPLDEDEVILLRVRNVAQLPNQAEVVATRLAAIRDADMRDQRPARLLDELTSAQIEMSAFECEVLGTFYPDTVAGQQFIQWGADLDNVYAGARYFVYTPGPEVLSYIASYPELTEDEILEGETPHLITIGNVRFAATRRRAKSAGLEDVPVRVRVTDFVSRKTAVLGMTRAGKSNTNKTVCTAVFEHSRLINKPIGQLIFDPQGEYAAVNDQDKTALRLLGEEWVRIYKFRPDPTKPQEHALTVNFYDQRELEAIRGLIEECVSDIDSGYVQAFKAAEVTEPDQDDYATRGAYEGARQQAALGRFALYALLAKAGFKVPVGWKGVKIQMAGAMRDAILDDHPDAVTADATAGYVWVKTPDGLQNTMNWLCKRLTEAASKAGLPQKYASLDFSKWQNASAWGAIRAAYDGTGGTAVLNHLRNFTEFHDPRSTGNFVPKVLRDLGNGMIVIVDLSFGSERVGVRMSERLVRGLLDAASKRFTSGLKPLPIQVVVEEAHRLFDRERANKNDSDPWVRLAKEAAKYKIGLMYATQEVSSIDPRILSATHNWVIAHLNSDRETKELAHYYDYGEFADEIRRSEDRGFVRMKTFSSKYIVPVQVAKFDHAMINGARASAGLPAILDLGI